MIISTNQPKGVFFYYSSFTGKVCKLNSTMDMEKKDLGKPFKMCEIILFSPGTGFTVDVNWDSNVNTKNSYMERPVQ